MSGLVTDIQRFSLHDGPGIRTTVFLKGCSLHCPWCHNPETQSRRKEILFFSDMCLGCTHCAFEDGKPCVTGARRVCGREYTPGELAAALLRDLPFYGEDGGITFSGGEALLRAGFVRQTIDCCRRQAAVHCCIDTALCVPLSQWEPLADAADLFLADIKLLDPDMSRRITGADPGILTANLRYLSSKNREVWIRIPTLPGFNDTDREISLAASLLSSLDSVTKIQTLPVFGHGARKYRALGREPDESWFSPDAEALAAGHAEKLSRLLGRDVTPIL